MLPICIISTTLFAALAVMVSTGVTYGFDSSILLWINQHASPAIDAFFVAVTQLGGVIFVTTAALAMVGYFIYKKKYRNALFVAVSIGGVALLNVILKSFFDRARPDLWEWIIQETSLSFPSGHATASMTVAVCIVILVWNTKWRIWALWTLSFYVLVIGLSRLYLGVHYPTDILGGWLLGIAWTALIALLLKKSRRFSRKLAKSES